MNIFFTRLLLICILLDLEANFTIKNNETFILNTNDIILIIDMLKYDNFKCDKRFSGIWIEF